MTVAELHDMGGKSYWHVSLIGNGSEWRIMDKYIAENPEVYGYGLHWSAYKNEKLTTKESEMDKV